MLSDPHRLKSASTTLPARTTAQLSAWLVSRTYAILPQPDGGRYLRYGLNGPQGCSNKIAMRVTDAPRPLIGLQVTASAWPTNFPAAICSRVAVAARADPSARKSCCSTSPFLHPRCLG